MESTLNITSVEERLEYPEIFIDSGFAVKRERNRTVRNRHVDQFDMIKSICKLTFMKQVLAAGRVWIRYFSRCLTALNSRASASIYKGCGSRFRLSVKDGSIGSY